MTAPSITDATDLPDLALLQAHVSGDSEAFNTLYKRHRDRLWAIALRTAGNPEDAADGLQEAMLSAFRNAHKFRGAAQVTTWLHRIVVNACLDRIRRAASRPTVNLPEDHSPAASVADGVTDLDRREVRWDVESALRQLPYDQRAAIVLVDMEGYSVDEAATLLDCPSGTVKSRCARGRAKLAASLSHLRNPPHAPSVPPTGEQSPVQANEGRGHD